MILRLFTYLCGKSIQTAKKLVSRENGFKQMFKVLNSFAVSYLNLIGQSKYSCQNPDQAKTLLERGQNWSQWPNFDQFAQCEWSVLNKSELRPNEIRKLKYDHIQLKDVAMYLYKHIIVYLCNIKYPVLNTIKAWVKIITW